MKHIRESNALDFRPGLCPCCQRLMAPGRKKTRRKYGAVVLMTIDHIVRRADGGTDHPSNLRLVCIDCNSSLPQFDQSIEKLQHFIRTDNTNKVRNWWNSPLRIRVEK